MLKKTTINQTKLLLANTHPIYIHTRLIATKPKSKPFFIEQDAAEPASVVRFVTNKQLKAGGKPGSFARSKLLFHGDDSSVPKNIEPRERTSNVRDPSRFKWRHLIEKGKNDE